MPRIIYDFRREDQITTSASARPYGLSVGEIGPTYGFQTEMLIVGVDRGGNEEAVAIHGDARTIRRALVDAVSAIDTMGEHYVQKGELRPDWMSPDTEDDSEHPYETCGYDPCPCGRWRLDLLTRCWEPVRSQEEEHAASAPTKPTIITLCGSCRFYPAFQKANYELTMRGNIVLSVGFFPGNEHGESVGMPPEHKQAADILHFRKIEMSDEIFVLNVDGYIGESTTNEIALAFFLHKKVRFLQEVEGETWLMGKIEDMGKLGAAAYERMKST